MGHGDPRGVGGWSADPLLLLSPLLLILAVGSLLFRFLPLVLGIIARVVAMGAGPARRWDSGNSRAARRVIRSTALLVVMAASVGTFAATYSATTDRSQEERARFAAGSDSGRPASASSIGRRRQVEALDSVPGVEASAAALRASMPLGPTPALQDSVQVLGIDPSVTPSAALVPARLRGRRHRRPEPAAGSPASGAGIALPGEPCRSAFGPACRRRDNKRRCGCARWIGAASFAS